MSVKYIRTENKHNRFIIVGEAPGKEEVEEGKPFVGKSGKLIFNVLSDFNFKREDCCITNVVKVRPTNNRTPTTEEINSWIPTLNNDIFQSEPLVVLCFGAVAAKALLGYDSLKLSEVRGVELNPNNYLKVVCTYHPSYIFRKFSKIEVFKRDIKLATDLYNEQIKRIKEA